MSRKTYLPLSALIVLAALLWTSTAVSSPSTKTVMSGLDNPRGLAFAPDGSLYVAEAGRGGSGPCITLRGLVHCYGPTGAVSRLKKWKQERIVTGLPSYAGPTGEATGPHDVSFVGTGGGFVSLGLGFEGQARSALDSVGTQQFGWLLRLLPNGTTQRLVDVSAHEFSTNPGGGQLDSNPFGILAEPGQQIVADAAANALLRVRANGEISTIASFPSRAQGRPTDSVPTSVAKGPDGAYYVGELTGVPFAAGAASVWRVVPGQVPTIAWGGFKTIIDLVFGPDGSLYVLEHASGPVFFGGPGQLWRIAPDGTRDATPVLTGLDRPTSVVVGKHGSIYVTNHGLSVGGGTVLRHDP